MGANSNSLSVKISSGRPFVDHIPGSVEYCMGFASRTDYLVYEFGALDRVDLRPGEKVTFNVQPAIGENFRFVGVPFGMERMDKANFWRATFVSEHWLGLMSMEPTFGKGLTSDVAASIYTAAGVPKVTKDDSDVNVESVVFPATTRRSKAIAYLLRRSTTSRKGFLLGTVVGDVAYIVDPLNVRHTVKDLYYQVVHISDDRKRVDALGGLSSSVVSDSADVPETDSSKGGTQQVRVVRTSSVTDARLAAAFLRVKQARAYYGGYTAVISVLGWVPMIGRHFLVAKGDMYRDLSWMEQLDDGRYFAYSQVARVDFNSSKPTTQVGLMLTDDKV